MAAQKEWGKWCADKLRLRVVHHSPTAWDWRFSRIPAGGMFVWVKLPDGIDADRLLAPAVARKVAFVPGSTFFVGEVRRNYARLNFSNQPPDRIREGVKRLGVVIREQLAAAA